MSKIRRRKANSLKIFLVIIIAGFEDIALHAQSDRSPYDVVVSSRAAQIRRYGMRLLNRVAEPVVNERLLALRAFQKGNGAQLNAFTSHRIGSILWSLRTLRVDPAKWTKL